MIWSLARAEGLSAHDASDVEQVVWLRLVEHIHTLRKPSQVRWWLLTTARNESRRLRSANQRVRPIADPIETTTAPPADQAAYEHERLRFVVHTLLRVPPPCNVLLRLLARDPSPDAATLAAVTGIAVDDLPNARRRCLRLFRRYLGTTRNPP